MQFWRTGNESPETLSSSPEFTALGSVFSGFYFLTAPNLQKFLRKDKKSELKVQFWLTCIKMLKKHLVKVQNSELKVQFLLNCFLKRHKSSEITAQSPEFRA